MNKARSIRIASLLCILIAFSISLSSASTTTTRYIYWNIGNTFVIDSRWIIQKEVTTTAEETLILNDSSSITKAIGAVVLEAINYELGKIYADIQFAKSLNFLNYELIKIWDSSNMNKAIIGILTETMTGTLKLWDTVAMNKELAFLSGIILRVWDSSGMNKAVTIRTFEAFETVILHVTASFSSVLATSLDLILGIAGLALILALCALGLTFIRKRKE